MNSKFVYMTSQTVYEGDKRNGEKVDTVYPARLALCLRSRFLVVRY